MFISNRGRQTTCISKREPDRLYTCNNSELRIDWRRSTLFHFTRGVGTCKVYTQACVRQLGLLVRRSRPITWWQSIRNIINADHSRVGQDVSSCRHHNGNTATIIVGFRCCDYVVFCSSDSRVTSEKAETFWLKWSSSVFFWIFCLWDSYLYLRW